MNYEGDYEVQNSTFIRYQAETFPLVSVIAWMMKKPQLNTWRCQEVYFRPIIIRGATRGKVALTFLLMSKPCKVENFLYLWQLQG